MIKLVIRKVRPNAENRLRTWMAELDRRKTEVLETFEKEGVSHEQAYLLSTADGPVLIYAMESADHARAAAAFRDSTLPIDSEHRRIMKEVLAEPADVELLYECRADA